MRDFDLEPVLVKSAYTYQQQKRFMLYRTRLIRKVVYLSWLVMLPLCIYDYFNETETLFATIAYLVFWVFLTLAASGVFYTRSIYEHGNDDYFGGVTYVVKSDCFTVEKRFSGEMNYFYELFYKVVETDEMFYVFTTPFQYEMLEKKGIENGTAEEIRELMRAKMKSRRYKIVKMK